MACTAVAEVDFVDIDPSTGLISLEALEAKLTKAQKQGCLPKVLVPVHLAGTSCPMAELAALARSYGFKLLEDASHAVGGVYQGRPVGSGEHSSITVFSFHPVKIVTTGEGGAALTNDPILAERLQRLRSHGIAREAFEYETPGPWYYEQQELGFNYRLTDLQAALGLSQLERLEEFVDCRRALMDRYRTAVEHWPVEFLEEPADCRSAYHLAVLRLPVLLPHSTGRYLKVCVPVELVCSSTIGLYICSRTISVWVFVLVITPARRDMHAPLLVFHFSLACAMRSRRGCFLPLPSACGSRDVCEASTGSVSGLGSDRLWLRRRSPLSLGSASLISKDPQSRQSLGLPSWI